MEVQAAINWLERRRIFPAQAVEYLERQTRLLDLLEVTAQVFPALYDKYRQQSMREELTRRFVNEFCDAFNRHYWYCPGYDDEGFWIWESIPFQPLIEEYWNQFADQLPLASQALLLLFNEDVHPQELRQLTDAERAAIAKAKGKVTTEALLIVEAGFPAPLSYTSTAVQVLFKSTDNYWIDAPAESEVEPIDWTAENLYAMKVEYDAAQILLAQAEQVDKWIAADRRRLFDLCRLWKKAVRWKRQPAAAKPLVEVIADEE